VTSRPESGLGRFPHNNFTYCLTPLFKALFIFRSRYLCAIGLPMIFSLNRGIPAVRTAFPSSTTRAWARFARRYLGLRGYHPLWRSFPGKLFRGRLGQAHTYTTIPKGFGLDFSHFARRYYGNHSCFLFLRLMICLSSARGLPQLRPRRIVWYKP
jgi:hypothetical protein